MSRPAVVYIVMVFALVGGLWAVLTIGKHLSAPTDIAGKWALTPVSQSAAQNLNVEQSGRFFQVSFEHGPQMNLKLKNSAPLVLANQTWQLTFDSVGEGDDSAIRLEGPTPGRWNAHRVVRTFPADVQSGAAK